MTNRRIYKYRVVDSAGHCDPPLPESAEIIHVGEQIGALTVWAHVDPQITGPEKTVRVYGTGMDVRNGDRHVGSTQIAGYVWRVYVEGVA